MCVLGRTVTVVGLVVRVFRGEWLALACCGLMVFRARETVVGLCEDVAVGYAILARLRCFWWGSRGWVILGCWWLRLEAAVVSVRVWGPLG